MIATQLTNQAFAEGCVRVGCDRTGLVGIGEALAQVLSAHGLNSDPSHAGGLPRPELAQALAGPQSRSNQQLAA